MDTPFKSQLLKLYAYRHVVLLQQRVRSTQRGLTVGRAEHLACKICLDVLELLLVCVRRVVLLCECVNMSAANEEVKTTLLRPYAKRAVTSRAVTSLIC